MKERKAKINSEKVKIKKNEEWNREYNGRREKYETITGKKRGGSGKTTAKNEKRRRQKENEGKKRNK